MKHMVVFILFLIYTIGIFAIPGYFVILWGISINLICMVMQGTSMKRALDNLYSFMGVILFTGIVNVVVVDFYYGSMIALKLMIVCNMTYIFANSMTNLELAETIANIMSPLKILKVDIDSIKIMICIALSCIPIVKQELTNIRFSLKAKGCKTDSFHLLLQSKWILLPILTSILKRMNEIEHGLKAKAYVNE